MSTSRRKRLPAAARKKSVPVEAVRGMVRFGLWVSLAGLGLTGSLRAAEEPYQPVASYRIQATLDPVTKTIKGEEWVTWTNTTTQPARDLRFHLYLNAFKNNRSTFAREQGGPLWTVDGNIPSDYWGSIDIDSMDWLDADSRPEAGRILNVEHVQPDDDNIDDETVLRVELAEAVAPGESARLEIRFRSKLPRGIARTGWVEDYFFAGQWYPKIGVLEEDGWNCHQYHANTEYFADYGSYDLSVTVPSNFKVGGTGSGESLENPDGTTTHKFTAERVHDVAWVASPRFLTKRLKFEEKGLPPVEVVFLLLPEHESLGDRYLASTATALRLFGEWFGPYPYPRLTVVDPARGSDTGGMEYPTLITGGTSFWSPPETLSPEGVTIHETGHQWWFGMVSTNEFEEAWLDEGINSWSEARALKHSYPRAQYVARYLGGIPFVFPAMEIPYQTANLSPVRRYGSLDIMTEPSWRLRNSRSYVVNAYHKPELVLWTLENLLGEERMLKSMRFYFQRRQFGHPKTRDFISDVSQGAGQDLSWFFDETFESSDLVDYAIGSAFSSRIPPIQGRRPDSSLDPDEDEDIEAGSSDDGATYLTEVVAARLGGARLPVEVLMVFADGQRIRETWDGRARWKRFKYELPSRLRYAVVDPDHKLALDIDPVNNSRWVEGAGEVDDSPAVFKWTSKWLFWVQNLMETFSFLG